MLEPTLANSGLSMERTRKVDWLIAQGYRSSTLPPIVTWYRKDGSELRGRTDDYTLGLYRSKGFVLDRKYLDPQLWHELEYGIPRPSKPVEPHQPSGRTPPRLARAIRGAMSGRDYWEGTASELLSMIPFGKVGIPKDSTRLSTAVMKPYITDALKHYGLTVHRKRTASRRLLVFSR
jgi:hypothetical protein